MEFEKGTAGKTSGERPITRWRRDQEEAGPSTKVDRPPTGMVVRSQSKVYERPRSRRGHKDDAAAREQHINSATFRTATPGRFALARPPSASLMSGRPPTAAPGPTRIGSGLGRIATGLGGPIAKQFNVNMLDRPITQHGIAGVRPGTTKGLPMR